MSGFWCCRYYEHLSEYISSLERHTEKFGEWFVWGSFFLSGGDLVFAFLFLVERVGIYRVSFGGFVTSLICVFLGWIYCRFLIFLNKLSFVCYAM